MVCCRCPQVGLVAVNVMGQEADEAAASAAARPAASLRTSGEGPRCVRDAVFDCISVTDASVTISSVAALKPGAVGRAFTIWL